MRKAIVAAITVFLIAALILIVAANRSRHAFATFDYRVFLKMEYLPEVRRKTGYWPHDLNGVSRFIKLKIRNESARGGISRFREILAAHETLYERFEIANETSDQLTYRLRLDHREYTEITNKTDSLD